MSVETRKAGSIDQIFSLGSVRSDRWRCLQNLAKQWQRDQTVPSALHDEFNQLRDSEILYAYPGRALIARLANYLQTDNQQAFLDLASRISFSILARYYKEYPRDWEAAPEFDHGYLEQRHPGEEVGGGRPYFELLVVAPSGSSYLERNIQLLRSQRRKEDDFVYEPVVVESFQDAFCAIAKNSNIAAVVIFEGIDFKSKQSMPLLDGALCFSQ